MAFVHLHNHSDFSILDAATRVSDMVKRAVDLGMPALALTDHGYMFGIPDFDMECRKYNDAQKDMGQWRHDVECFQKGWELEEPEPDAEDAAPHDRVHAQWASDVAVWNETHDLEAVRANRPSLLIKPIFGCEAYFITDDCIEKGTRQHRYHLILLAKNETGYVNLMKMMSEAASGEMFYYYPRTTLDMLRRYHEGIICTSACVSGIIPRMFFQGRPEEARRWALTYQEIFGEDFYLEVQDHGLADPNWGGFTDRTLSEQILKMGHELGIKVIATNDNHYLTRDDAPTQDVLSCIGTASKLDDDNRKRMTGTEFYIKSEAEMRELFSWAPEVIDNTLEVASKCNYELDWTHMYLPKFPDLDPGETSEERFRKECETGLARRYGENWRDLTIGGENVKQRFEYEYKVICEKGFADYFLIVQEYVRWAKRNGIGVGPGRGSAAGAIVAYAMDITTFDPLDNGLMFERFLSPQRSEMPDIDMDFDDERRLEVVEHVRQLYGPERVCHVITYSTIKAKQAINDAARVLGFPVWQGQKLSKMLANDPKLTLDHALHKSEKAPDQYSPDFEEAYNKEADSRSIIDAALSIEGLHRGEGVHACAVLIAPTPVNDHVPTKIDTKGGVEITQYEGHSVADMGLLKMDFLGLRTLTVISKALANIKANHGIDINVDEIPFDDPEIYKLMREGRTAGVFQIESAGMTSTIKNMRPTEYKQVVALIALYRPGPLGAGMVTSYINRMNGREEAVSYDPRLDDILGETYGTMVYQEQVMKISMKMSGFSAGESDSRIRKPVAKKKIKLLTSTVFHWDDGKDETTYDHWMNGAVKNGYKKEIAQRIWDDVLEFASYAFNKSHSAGYAILVMQTAWLKAHYPREYMASVLTSYMGKTDKIVHYVTAYRHEGVAILPPDINESGRDFTAVPEGVRFGFAGIRGVGEGVGEAIMEEREKNGPFANLHDFVDRMDTGQANRRVVEALICSGAFDSTGYTRMQLMRFVDKANPENIIDAATKRQKERAAGQFSMFDLFGDVEGSGFENTVPEPDGVEWDRSVKLAKEHEVLGLYVSDHPLRPYEYALAKNRDYTIADIEVAEEYTDSSGGVHERFKVPEGKVIRLAGMVTAVQKKTTKNGDSMAIVTLEDMEGEVTLVVFPKLYKKCASTLAGQVDEETGESSGDVFVKVEGKLERGDRGNQVICMGVDPLVLDERSNRPKVLEVNIPAALLTRPYMDSLGQILGRYPGLDHVELRVESSSGDVMRMELPTRIDARNMVLMAEMIDLVGRQGHVKVA
ncbi:DNA polymerase III subunit alpha [Thermophilibacter mediterraneus]|uniref:DNA polymerase III subunit alpha n=1 Tax=Thermophilibacter mediterraneus TaxID=1871031 RepID=UPI000931D387|nr:DNA polymerase III subunit alpha [Thermophilibacter mediterraneus]